MYFFLLALLVGAASAAPLDSDKDAPVLRFDSSVGVDDFHYAYETGNGISAHSSGKTKKIGTDSEALAHDGDFQYTAPDGSKISLVYSADENGFQPQGEHLPTPPPIPAAILRAIEYNAAYAPVDTPRKF